MKQSNEWKRVLTAYEAGFRVLEDGSILSHTGDIIGGYIKTAADGDQRRRISIRYEGKPTSIPVHKLQAYQLFGDKALKKGVVVRHLDGNSLNNAVDNIAIGTQRDNAFDRPKEARVAHAKKSSMKRRKLTEEQVQELRTDRQEGFTYRQLVDKYGLAKSTICYILQGKTYC